MTEQEQRVINVISTLVPKMNGKELMALLDLANKVYERIENEKLYNSNNQISHKTRF